MTTAPDGTAYDLHGPKGAPVVALIHGLGLTRATWDGHITALSARFRVLTYDLAGHGETAVPEGEITLSTFSEQLVRLMDHLGLPSVAAVGFSLGGMINRRLAMDHPGRVWALGILNSHRKFFISFVAPVFWKAMRTKRFVTKVTGRTAWP